MRLRTILIALAIVLLSVAVFATWAVFRFSGCNYDTIRELASPSGRYVARWVSIDCGMNAHGNEVLVQERLLPGLPGVDGRPAGVRVSSDFFAIDRGTELRWEDDTLVLLYPTQTAPVLERTRVGGARIETRRHP